MLSHSGAVCTAQLEKVVDFHEPRSIRMRSKPSGSRMLCVVFSGKFNIFSLSSLTCPELCEVGAPNVIVPFYRWTHWGTEKCCDLLRVIKLAGNTDQSSDHKGRSAVLHVFFWDHRDRTKANMGTWSYPLPSSPGGVSEIVLSPCSVSHCPYTGEERPRLLSYGWDQILYSFSEICFPISA